MRYGDCEPLSPTCLVCVGAGPETRRWGSDAGGTLPPFGVEVGFGGTEPGLPLSLTIGAYLLDEVGGPVWR